MKLWVSVDVTDEVSLRFGLGCHIRRSAPVSLKHDGPTGQTTGLADWPI